jgi:hypothetical protein
LHGGFRAGIRVRCFFLKEYLDLSATFAAGLAFISGLAAVAAVNF